ncbi:hypothetical protein KEJ39_00005 [Candidatus Bathyarchaeota archaeon]|nr:hypothetical protein [Candidatus Bathyarchaeota archaeon]
MYSQTYRLSQDSNVRLNEAGKVLMEATVLASEAASKLDAANKILLEANRRLEEVDNVMKETKSLLSEIERQGVVNITSMAVDDMPRLYYFAGEPLLGVRLVMKVSSLSKYTVYYESSIVEISSSSMNFSGRVYGLAEFARITNAQTDLEAPIWNQETRALGTDIPQVAFWIGLRGLAFQRHGVLLLDPKENVTLVLNLKIEIIQAHTSLVMHQASLRLLCEIGPREQISLRIVA